jgi:predicted TIM-barrel fold metal-dependent hydrolase
LGTTYPIYALPKNEEVAPVLLSHPDRFYGWIFVNPVATDPIAELDKWAGQPGWIGVKSHPFWHRYPIAALDDSAAYCEDRNLPLLVHLGGDRERGDFRFLPERHPRLKVIYAHAGVPFYREVWDYANGRDNVFVDLSNPVYVNGRVRSEAIKALGAEKCLHATDGPYLGADQGTMLAKIDRLPLSAAEKGRILGDNFMDILDR